MEWDSSQNANQDQESWGQEASGWDDDEDYSGTQAKLGEGPGQQKKFPSSFQLGDTTQFPKSKDGNFIFLKMEDVKKLIPEKLEDLRETYGLEISDDEALLGLRYFHWNADRFQDQWFDNEIKVKQKIGILQDKKNSTVQNQQSLQASLKNQNNGICIVCTSEFEKNLDSGDPLYLPLSLSCGHQFCIGCWKEYLTGQIKSQGIQILNTPCQQAGCNIIVAHSIFYKLFDGKYSDSPKQKLEDKKLLKIYERMHCKSFTDDNRMVKWCPYVKECDFAAQKVKDFTTFQVVNCICGNSFCFSCGQEQHWPADCEMHKQWEIKNSNESENLLWIIANTKQCPNKKCGKFIEKNQGCNHMVCRQCSHEFCWLCLGEWKDHNGATGGYYKCNKYEELNNDTPIKKQEEKQKKAQSEINRYVFHFERFNNHQKSQKLAIGLRSVIKDKIRMLHEYKNYHISELEFLEQALEETIKCRQVLKYTYCYAFLANLQGVNQQLFEHQQTLLEEACDLLHEQVEKPLDVFLDPSVVERTPFFKYKSNLVNLTNVTSSNYKSFLTKQNH